jgi:hypothetical protein
MGCELVEEVLNLLVNMAHWKKINLKKKKTKKTPFHAYLFGNGLNIIRIW